MTLFNEFNCFLLLDTWRKDVKPQEIEDSINNAEPGRVRVISVAKVNVDIGT